MKRSVFLLLFCLSFLWQSCVQNDNPKSITKHVVVIGVDGMSPDGINNANTPNLDHFIKNGAHTFTARAVLPTSSSPNWASMIMGAGPAQHGITSNGWERENQPMPPAIVGTEDIFPSIFSVLKIQAPEAYSAVIYHWGGFGRLFEKSAVSFEQHGDDQFKTTQVAREQIRENQPAFTFIHLDHVDHAGHHYGHGTDHYYESVEEADSLIGEIWQAVESTDMQDQTVILVTSDHGGINYGHGGETLAEIEIPFILYGQGIKQGYEIPERVYMYDNAAMVAHLLGLQRPQAWIGRPVYSAIEGNDYQDINAFQMPAPAKLAKPTILPKAQLMMPAGGLFAEEIPPVKMTHSDPAAKIYYTTDGSMPSLQSNLYEVPFELSENTIIRAIAEKDGEFSDVQVAYYRIVEDKEPSVICQLYQVEEINKLSDFKTTTPIQEHNLHEFALLPEWQTTNNLVVKLKSKIKIDEPGTYHFFLNSDDGSKLFIDQNLVVDNDGDHGVLERSGKIDLEAGIFPIQVDYFNAGGRGWLDVHMKSPGSEKQWIMPDQLVKP